MYDNVSSPAYEYHFSGQATAWFFTASADRTAIYFGSHGTAQSWAKYHALCEQYKNNGFALPEWSAPQNLMRAL